jgi:flagellar biosynthesis chaperone FliJ
MNKSVLDKLGKFETNVELAETNVELAMFKSVAEIEKMYNDIKSILDENTKYKKQIQEAVTALLNNGGSMVTRTSQFIDEANKTINEAKALGLEAPKRILDLPKFARDFDKIGKAQIKFANTARQGLSSF